MLMRAGILQHSELSLLHECTPEQSKLRAGPPTCPPSCSRKLLFSELVDSMVKVQMCCRTFPLASLGVSASLLCSSTLEKQWGTAQGGTPTARAALLPFACFQKRDFSLHLMPALSLTPQLYLVGRVCCGVLVQAPSLCQLTVDSEINSPSHCKSWTHP